MNTLIGGKKDIAGIIPRDENKAAARQKQKLHLESPAFPSHRGHSCIFIGAANEHWVYLHDSHGLQTADNPGVASAVPNTRLCKTM